MVLHTEVVMFLHSRPLLTNFKGRVDEVIRVNHPLTCDQEFFIFIFASQREREEGPPNRSLIAHSPCHSLRKKNDILVFTETRLDNSISDGEVSLRGYSIFRSDRTNGRGGGIAVHVKETLSVIKRADLEKDFVGECMWLKLLLPKAKGILFATFLSKSVTICFP